MQIHLDALINKGLELAMREKCYSCMRPKSSCLCKYCSPIDTKTKFVILMHPMEYKKVKNGTGFITNLQLQNSEIIVDIDFTNNLRVNNLIQKYDTYVLYPGKDAINLNSKMESTRLSDNRLFFIIDATWPCAKKMMKLSKNLQKLPTVSFDNKNPSKFTIKQQPHKLCLSTIESVEKVLEAFNDSGVEEVESSSFLNPFNKLIEYQLECIERDDNKNYRPYLRKNIIKKDKYKVNPERTIFFDEENFV